MNAPADGWELDFEVALRVLRRRWWDEVQDLVAASAGETLAWDELDLDDDLVGLERVVGPGKLARLARRALGAAGPEPADDPGLRALEGPEAAGRAFLRLVGANLAFALRTEELLLALAQSVAGAAPRLAAEVAGSLLARARSARWARETLGGLASLPAPERERARAAAQPSARAGDYRVLHVRAEPEAVGEALERWRERHELKPVEWGVRKSRTEDSADERYLVSKPRAGWSTIIARGGLDRARALELSGAAPGLGRAAWAERQGDQARYAILEGGRVLDDESKLRERLGALELDDVAGALRALGIAAHDPAAPGGDLALAFEDYVAEGRSSSPARLRRQGVTGFAFAVKKSKKD